VVKFDILKSRFIALYRASHTYFSPNASMPALHLHLRRNISQSAPGQILPAAYQTLASVQADLQEGFVFFNKADLASAKQIFVQALLSMLLVVVSSDEEAKQVRPITCDFTNVTYTTSSGETSSLWDENISSA
jgi:coatomer subunit alpha